MAEKIKEERGAWSSRWGFIMAAAGSAVGLGNIWKFPYITGENGGGLFVLIYLCCIALVGLPIMVAEIMIGRAAQKQPVGAFARIQGGRTAWSAVGWLGIVSGFVILSYYVVVAGWAMDYTLKSVVNFTKDIHDEAAVEATTARATTPLETMRRELAERRAEHDSRSEIEDLRRRAPAFVWKDFERFQTARARAAEAGGDPAAMEAEKRLLADEKLAGSVKVARELTRRMDAAREAGLKQARQWVSSLPEAELLARYEDQVRRDGIRDRVARTFVDMASDGWTATFWALLFMLLAILIVSMGISSGIERWCKILMPVLIVLITVMVIYGTTRTGFSAALSFVFKPDASKLKASGVLEALGHAFFTLSLGMGAMITYGSYQKSKDGLIGQSIAIAGMDTLIALLACMMMFPIVFSYGQEPAAGPGLVFMSMPLAFSEIGTGGMLLAIIFFGLLVFAALTSAISLLEVVASYFIDQRGWSRHRAAWTLGGAIFLFGLPSAFAMAPDPVFSSWESTFGKNFFDTMDYLASNWLLAMGGLLIAVYAGWVMPKRIIDAEFEGAGRAFILAWSALIRWVAPVLVIVVLAQKVGLLDADAIFYSLGL